MTANSKRPVSTSTRALNQNPMVKETAISTTGTTVNAVAALDGSGTKQSRVLVPISMRPYKRQAT